jgi:ABC-type transport system involved in multi-copper enzyme maturation permease subunit
MILLRSISSEVLKVTTTRLWWVIALVLLGYVGFTAALLAGLLGGFSDQLGGSSGAPQIPPGTLPPIVYSVATAIGYVFPVLLGALATTGEFRHQTITPTFLATPRRWTVLIAKLIVGLLVGALLGVIALVASMGLGAPILAAVGIDPVLDDPDTWALAARVVLAMAIWAALGVGLGVLVPNQVAVIVIVLAFTQFVEPILRFGASVWEWTADLGRFLPGAASDALVGSSFFTTLGGAATTVDPLLWWQGGLVLAATAAVIVLAGALTTWRRDVT